MAFENRTFTAGGTRVEKGTGMFDTEYGRVLWVSYIDDTGITVETVSTYEVDRPIGWSPTEGRRAITDGTVLGLQGFKQLVEDGRLDISP